MIQQSTYWYLPEGFKNNISKDAFSLGLNIRHMLMSLYICINTLELIPEKFGDHIIWYLTKRKAVNK